MDRIHISYRNGCMDIYLPEFFPCNSTKFKKLLKVVEMDYENSETIKKDLREHFKERIAACEVSKKNNESWRQMRESVAERIKSQIASGKDSDGELLSKGDIRRMKAGMKEALEDARYYKHTCLKCERDKEKFEQQLKML